MKYGKTPRLGPWQRAILRELKSQPLNFYRLRARIGFPRYRQNDMWRSISGLIKLGLVEMGYHGDTVYGDTLRVTQKGKAIAQRKGVLTA